MNNLKTSTKVLILLIITALLLGIVLLVTMPDSLSELIQQRHTLLMNGDFSQLQRYDGMSSGRGGYVGRNHMSNGHMGGFGGFSFLGLILLIGLIIFFVSKGRKYHKHGHHGRAILDVLFAEGKITKEEYQRRKTIIEEEDK